VALGGFDPLERFTRSYSRRHYTIPPQSLLEDGARYENYRGCRHARPRTAELRFQYESSMPPAPPAVPAVPVTPDAPVFDDEQAPPPPPTKAPRARR
jgi:hypothetical protein